MAGEADVVVITLKDATLSIDGRKRYRIERPGHRDEWSPLESIAKRADIESTENGGVTVSVRGPNRYLVRVTEIGRVEIFRGTIVPKAGVVYVRDATIESSPVSYSGSSQHDCSYWDGVTDVNEALRKYESRTPR